MCLELLVLALIFAPLSTFGDELSWDESCSTGTWNCECMEEGQGSCTGTGYTNWSMDQLPGPGDTAVIGPAGLPVVLVSPHTTLDSIQAQRSLEVFPNLTLEGMSSSFHDLVLHPGILLANGTIQISGNSSLNRFIGAISRRGAGPPLTVSADGTLNLNGMTLANGAEFINNGAATVSLNDLHINNGSFINNNSLTLMPQQDFFGDQRQFENNGMLSIQPGGVMVFDPEYSQNSGSLVVQSGIANFRSRALHFLGGTVNIPEGGILEVKSPFVSTIDGSFNGLSSIDGRGQFVLWEEMDVLQTLTLNLGLCYFMAQEGFVLRGGRLTLHDMLTNTGRMRFESGLLTGTSTFENSGCVVAIDGAATINVPVSNRVLGAFIIANHSLAANSDFDNQGAVLLGGQSAGISGSDPGTIFRNFREFQVWGDDPASVFDVATRFRNERKGVVDVITGELSFTGLLLNLSSEILARGTWKVRNGIMNFATPIRELSVGCTVELHGGSIPQLQFLQKITGGARLIVNVNWGPLGNLTLTTDGWISTAQGPLRSVEEGIDQGQGATPVITISNLINESGIVKPNEVGELGTMQLVGNYQQEAGGMLAVDLSMSGADLFSIEGDAALAGSLEIRRLGDVLPGTTFTVLEVSNGTLTGAFDQILAEDVYSVEYFADHVEVTLDEIIGPMVDDGFE